MFIEKNAKDNEQIRKKVWHHIKITDFGVRPASEPWHLSMLAVSLRASYPNFLSLSSLLYDMGMIISTQPVSMGAWPPVLFFFFFNIYFWLCWVFVSV